MSKVGVDTIVKSKISEKNDLDEAESDGTDGDVGINKIPDRNNLDFMKLDRFYRRIWRSSLDLDLSNLNQHCDFLRNKFFNNDSLNENEKLYLFSKLQTYQEKFNLTNQAGERRKCEDCQNWTYAIDFCDHCIRNYLRKNFVNWTSGNEKIDKAIQEAQKNVICPFQIVEWIPYENFENVQYLTVGGFATIYKAIWKDGYFTKWNSTTKKLERFGR